MKNVLKSEFLKLMTVPSTYGWLIGAILFIGGINFAIQVFVGQHITLGNEVIASTIKAVVGTVSLFVSIVAVIYMAQEYRNNTITYTLTNNKNRWQVLLAKAIVVSVYSLVFMLIVVGVAIIAQISAIYAKGGSLPAQTIDVFGLLWRSSFYVVAFSLFSLGVTVLVRSLVWALLIMIAGVNLVEGLLSLLLKENGVYQPFTALDYVLNNNLGDALQPGRAAGITVIWLVITWAIAVYLFANRDAN